MWRKLYFHNEKFELGVRALLRSGIVHINHDTGMIEPTSNAMDYDANWLFFGHTVASRDCYLWHQVMFNHFDRFVPEFCRLRCYKVVVKTRNFLDAIRFYNVMLAGPAIRSDLSIMHGKVGMDERWYTSGHFNGFIYCDGLKDALEKYAAVRETINEHVPDGENIPIIVKRTCTEFEKEYGPTDGKFWQSFSPDERNFQSHIEDIFKTVQSAAVQPDWLKNRIITKLVKWANAVGDKSWVDYFEEGDFLTMKAVTYHHLTQKGGSAGQPTKLSKVVASKRKSKKGE